jgi:hypothetical protein
MISAACQAPALTGAAFERETVTTMMAVTTRKALNAAIAPA